MTRNGADKKAPGCHQKAICPGTKVQQVSDAVKEKAIRRQDHSRRGENA